jgi:tetratricopeptide (TPR) repeat protein
VNRAAHLLSALVLAAAASAQTTRPTASPSAGPPAGSSVKALVQTARMQMSRKNAALALQTLGQALALAPNSEEVLAAYAEAALAAHAPVKALPALEALQRLAPSEARYRSLIGQALLKVGDPEAATPPLEEAERLDPRDVPTLVTLGTALNRRGLFAQAKTVLLRASTLDPDAVSVLAARAEAEAGLGDVDAAEARVRRALASSPEDGPANFVFGILRLAQEQYGEARRAFEKAAAADPESALVQEKLAAACKGAGDTLAAGKHADLARQREAERALRVKEARRLVGYETSERGAP